MKCRKPLIFLLFFLASNIPLIADTSWQVWQMQRNFPSTFVTTIVPAGDTIWVGGKPLMPGEDEGLASYDKTTRRWRLWMDTDGVLGDDINRLAWQDGILWIGCDGWQPFNQGLYSFDPATGQFTRFTPEDGLPHWRIKDIAVHGPEVWVATHAGAGEFDPEEQTWITHDRRQGIGNTFLICIAIDDDFVWAGSFTGLEVFDRQTREWTSHPAANSIFPAHVSAILTDTDHVWFASPPAIIRYDRRTGTFHEFLEGREVGALEVTHMRKHDDVIYFGTRHGGVHAWDILQRRWEVWTAETGLADDHIVALAVDADHIWTAGGLGSPISRMDRITRQWRHVPYREGVPTNFLFSLAQIDDWLFVGTMGNGFWKRHIPTGMWYNLNIRLLWEGREFVYADQFPIRVSDVYALLVDGQTVWLGTNQGLGRYDASWTRPGFEMLAGPRVAISALAAWQDHIVVATKRGELLAFNPATETWQTWETGDIGNSPIHTLMAEPDRLWLGTANGLWHLNAQDATPSPVEAFSRTSVQTLLAWQPEIWVGTRNGLYRFDPERGTASQPDTVPQAAITSLTRQKHVLWIASRNGLFRFDPNTGHADTHTRASTGLAWDHISNVVTDGTSVWTATLGGGLGSGAFPQPGEPQ